MFFFLTSDDGSRLSFKSFVFGGKKKERKKQNRLDSTKRHVYCHTAPTETFRLSWYFFVLQLQDPPDYRDSPVSGSQEHDRDRVELIKLPAHSSNGTIALNIPSFASSTPETEAPLNLSLKPQQSSSMSSTGSNSAQKSSLSSLSSLSASLGTPGMTPAVTERTCKPPIQLVVIGCGQVWRCFLNLFRPKIFFHSIIISLSLLPAL